MSRVLDNLSKGLAGATSRRGVLKYLAGALFLGAAGCFRRVSPRCHHLCSGCTGSAYHPCVTACEACTTGQLCVASGCGSMTCCPSATPTCCTNQATGAATCVNTSSSVFACGGCAGPGATSETRGSSGRGFDCTNGGKTKNICCGGVCCSATSGSCAANGGCP